jgi:hypothetical protein
VCDLCCQVVTTVQARVRMDDAGKRYRHEACNNKAQAHVQTLMCSLCVSDSNTFATSNFKSHYTDAKVPEFQDELFAALRRVLRAYCRLSGVQQEAGDVFFKHLEIEAFKGTEDVQDVISKIPATSQKIWTSALRMALAPVEHRRELAFIINSLLRSDDADAAPHLVVIVRAINTLLITRRGDLEIVKFPPNGVTYRGGGLPDAHRGFFTAGKQYRVPGFLATSFSWKVAEDFMMYADMREEPCVMWIVHVDPDGEHSKARRCMHVNFVERSNVKGEDEYLFAPYAPFTVIEVHEGSGLPCDPHVIKVLAALDSRDKKNFPEDLPLAPWY